MAGEEESGNSSLFPKKYGTVICQALNIRSGSNVDSDVLCIIRRGSKVEIDEAKSTKFFYAICTEAGVEGYCQKQYIRLS